MSDIVMDALLTRSQAEDFLFREAALIDDWQLGSWAALFDADGEYLVPPTADPDGDPSTTLFLIYDDRFRLEERAKRLMKRGAHAEFPRSKVRHMISNVRVEQGEDDCQRLLSNFVVYRSRGPGVDVYPGHAIHDVRVRDGEIRIRCKRVMIDTDTLRTQRRISIIL